MDRGIFPDPLLIFLNGGSAGGVQFDNLRGPSVPNFRCATGRRRQLGGLTEHDPRSRRGRYRRRLDRASFGIDRTGRFGGQVGGWHAPTQRSVRSARKFPYGFIGLQRQYGFGSTPQRRTQQPGFDRPIPFAGSRAINHGLIPNRNRFPLQQGRAAQFNHQRICFYRRSQRDLTGPTAPNRFQRFEIYLGGELLIFFQRQPLQAQIDRTISGQRKFEDILQFRLPNRALP